MKFVLALFALVASVQASHPQMHRAKDTKADSAWRNLLKERPVTSKKEATTLTLLDRWIPLSLWMSLSGTAMPMMSIETVRHPKVLLTCMCPLRHRSSSLLYCSVEDTVTTLSDMNTYISALLWSPYQRNVIPLKTMPQTISIDENYSDMCMGLLRRNHCKLLSSVAGRGRTHYQNGLQRNMATWD
jgi:hypothetical protein